jgi:RimJ/RimL family protein N-acetyltransferase
VTILVDECIWPWRDRLWCHLVSDSSYDELHSFAYQLGFPRVAFQGDHYDIHETARQHAITLGAIATTGISLVRALTKAGLRRGPQFTNRGLSGVAHLPAPTLRTKRLVLRQWTEPDLAPLSAIQTDPAVMTYLDGPRTMDQTRSQMDLDAIGLALRGIGKWAVELASTGELIGRVGLSGADPLLTFSPALEVGARLAASHHRQGYATEAGAAALRYAFEVLQVERVVGLASVANQRSQQAMARLGMTLVGHIDHPRFEEDDPLRPHVIYEARPSALPLAPS